MKAPKIAAPKRVLNFDTRDQSARPAGANRRALSSHAYSLRLPADCLPRSLTIS